MTNQGKDTHCNMKMAVKSILEAEGYSVGTEINTPENKYVIDVYGKRDGEDIAVEVGGLKADKKEY